MVTPARIFDMFAFQTSPQAVVFMLQMVNTALQLGHMSGLFLLLCFHILAPAKKLVFQGFIRWIAGHDDRIQRSDGLIGNYQSFGGWEITRKRMQLSPRKSSMSFFAWSFPQTALIVVS